MKGNLFLGTGRGSVGDVTFSRQKGQQTARARNRKPNNPRTVKQMTNRAKIASMVRFFSRSRQNLFNYAFESKKGNQSDYNAFVSLNSKDAVTNSFLAISQQWPMIGEYFLSQGSLSSINIAYNSTQRNPAIVLRPLASGVTPDNYTIGMLSQQLIDTYNLQNGDYMTFVVIRSQAKPAESIEEAIEYKALTSRVINAEWTIKQMQIDTTSNALVTSLGIFVIIGSASSVFSELQFIDNGNSYVANYVFGAAAIASRIGSDNKVKTSTSKIVVNAMTATACEVGRTTAWREWVGENWEEQEQEILRANDILKGSIAENQVNFNMPIDVRVNGREISPGAILNEYGPLVINSLGNYSIGQIKLFNDNTEWQPVSTSGNTATYNMQSSGMYIIKVGSDIIFTFRNVNEQDFTIRTIYDYNSFDPESPGNVQASGTYQQVQTVARTIINRWVQSTGKAIDTLTLSASDGVVVADRPKKDQYGNEWRRIDINLTNAVAPVSVKVGNVLILYISNLSDATATATEAKTATRKASKA